MAEPISVSKFIIYDIYDRGTEDIQIEIRMGAGQVGASLVKLQHDMIGEFENSFRARIGVSSELKNKTANILTTIQDIQPDTNLITLDVTLTGGKRTHNQSIINDSVPNHGDIASALITIQFI